MIKYKIRGPDWLTFPLIIVNFNQFLIQPAPGLPVCERIISVNLILSAVEHVFAALIGKILFLPLEDKIHIFAPFYQIT